MIGGARKEKKEKKPVLLRCSQVEEGRGKGKEWHTSRKKKAELIAARGGWQMHRVSRYKPTP